ncbi:hypothetical protein V8D89_015654 [Ganoderma adspersum]
MHTGGTGGRSRLCSSSARSPLCSAQLPRDGEPAMLAAFPLVLPSPQTLSSVVAILGGFSLATTFYLMSEHVSGDLETAARRARKFEPFVSDLQRFIDHSIVVGPETEATVVDYHRRFRLIMEGHSEYLDLVWKDAIMRRLRRASRKSRPYDAVQRSCRTFQHPSRLDMDITASFTSLCIK